MGPSRSLDRARLPAGPCPALLSATVVALAASFGLVGLSSGCKKATEVELWVDGFQPESVHFELEDLGALDTGALREVTSRPDVDGSLLLPDGACQGPCRVALVSVFVRNKGDAEAPPVIRLKSPPNRPARLPIAFRGDEISKGRVGRIRWVVEMWPEEERLTATLSSSVFLVESPPPRAPAAPTAPPASPTPPAPPAPGQNAPSPPR